MQSIKLTLIGGEFVDPVTERVYCAARFGETRRHAAVAMLAWGVVNALFFLSDFRFLGEAHYYVALAARTLVVGVSLAGAAAALRMNDFAGLSRLAAVWQWSNGLAAAALATSGGQAAFVAVYLLPALIYLTSLASFRATAAAGLGSGVLTMAGYVWGVGAGPDLLEQTLMLGLLNVGLAAAVSRDNRIGRKEWLAGEAERQAGAELAASRAMVERMFNAAPVPLVVSAVGDGRILRYNDAAKAAFGGDPASFGVASVRQIYADPEQRAELMRELAQRGQVSGHEARITLADGMTRDVLVSATLLDYEGAPAVMSGAVDITARKLLESHLAFLATSDSLTGLANRSRFFSAARRELRQSRGQGAPPAVLLADIDHFKRINDEYGHEAGDVALTAFAETLQTLLSPGDIAARLGGEEFAVLSPGADLAAAVHLAERLRATVERLAVDVGGGVCLKMTVSIGVAMIAEDEDGVDRALSRADRAMYRAKRTGRNRVTVAAEIADKEAEGA
jgi:diguanylate cyclase